MPEVQPFSYEKFVEFEQWRKDAPHRRSYTVFVNETNPGDVYVNVFVYDYVWKVGQNVQSVAEIDLAAVRRKEIREKTVRFLTGRRKRPAVADLVE